MSFSFTVKEFIIGNGTPKLQFYRRGFNLQGNGSTPEWQDIILKGTTALTLVNAKANSLEYLKLFGDTEQLPETHLDTVTLSGGCEQSGTPTPTTPIDIVCNNGVLKVSKNLFDNGTLYNWLFKEGVLTYNANRFAKYMRISSSETYTISRNDNYDVPLRIVQTEITPDNEVVYYIDGTTTYVQIERNQLPYTFTSRGSAKFLVFSADSSLTEAQAIDLFNKLQVEQGSTATTYMPYGQIYTQGTVETVTDSNGLTASAERLLAVGTYKDTQEVIAGSVTRNVGIKVLDGTETVTKNIVTTSPLGYYFGVETGTPHANNVESGFCTNFTITWNAASSLSDNTFALGSNQRMWFATSKFTEASDFKQWLAQQYANGTPVIIVYPTSSTTSEAVAGQFISKSPVTQTAGSISNLPIAITESQKTVPTPTQPLPINCNNGVVGIDSQGNITVTGTTETVEIDTTGDTATAENLFKVGTYQDVQSVLDGEVTRKVGIKVLDGSENFELTGTVFTTGIANRKPEKSAVICSHFLYSSKTSTQVEDERIVTFQSANVGFKYNACATIADFKQWLSDQYSNGTPVIVTYPLATPVTETVTAQPMNIQEGTNIVQITQGSIDGLELEVKYKAPV